MTCGTKGDSTQAVTNLDAVTTTSHSEQASIVASDLAQRHSATSLQPMACDMTGDSTQAATKFATRRAGSPTERASTAASELAHQRPATFVQPVTCHPTRTHHGLLLGLLLAWQSVQQNKHPQQL